ncbi:MAG: SIR2 family protein [Ignavibacteriales bacterium]|jgi:NAD-dependent SIR2 family protein deacetylase|nr:SIR2 family protein [Ignavibacteriales bacterium]MBK7981053.1 SIR2 family protein [Ignavibacteriota bacterium]
MKNCEQKYLNYLPQRDVVFVFGAGASQPDGVPLQKDILPMILSDKQKDIIESKIGSTVLEFINDNFKYDHKIKQYPQLEAVFGFLDYFIQQNESLNAKYTHNKIVEIKEYLIKLIHYIVNLKTHNQSKHYNLFWQAVDKYNKNISIITLNYDTLLEQSFDILFKKSGYIDYSIHLMNYDKISELKDYNFWINPREPVMVEKDLNPFAIKILKLHGSLNWKYCNCCNQVLLTPWDRTIDLHGGKFLGYKYPNNEKYEYFCPLDQTEFQTLIMPPSYLKSLNQPVISQLFSEASREIRDAKKIVFVGYSLSDADIHIKALFKKQLRKTTKVIVINSKKAAILENKYLAIAENIQFENLAFEEFVSDDKLLKETIS